MYIDTLYVALNKNADYCCILHLYIVQVQVHHKRRISIAYPRNKNRAMNIYAPL